MLLWKENHAGYEVESVCVVTLNLLTFQFVTGHERFYSMGIYIPPTDTIGVEDLHGACKACPAGCIPIVLGDLNIDFRDPRNEREELIVDFLDDMLTHRGDSLLVDHANNQPKHGGPSCTRGMGAHTTRNLIPSLQVRGTFGDFGMLDSVGRDTMTQPTEQLSRPF